jgi:hypothetical protein
MFLNSFGPLGYEGRYCLRLFGIPVSPDVIFPTEQSDLYRFRGIPRTRIQLYSFTGLAFFQVNFLRSFLETLYLGDISPGRYVQRLARLDFLQPGPPIFLF